jgi:rubrerythrin
MDIRKIYQYALGREYEGKHFFEENAGRLSHAAAAGAFRRLAQEEQKHIEFIQAQLSALEEGDLQYASIGEQIDETSYFIASKTEGEARQALEKLAFWERRHESLFKELHDKAFKEYAEMPWGG